MLLLVYKNINNFVSLFVIHIFDFSVTNLQKLIVPTVSNMDEFVIIWKINSRRFEEKNVLLAIVTTTVTATVAATVPPYLVL